MVLDLNFKVNNFTALIWSTTPNNTIWPFGSAHNNFRQMCMCINLFQMPKFSSTHSLQIAEWYIRNLFIVHRFWLNRCFFSPFAYFYHGKIDVKKVEFIVVWILNESENTILPILNLSGLDLQKICQHYRAFYA